MTGDGGFILDQPHQIEAFALLQVYFKLKLEAEHSGGPKWRDSPMKQAIAILEHNGIKVSKRTKLAVLDEYKQWLIDHEILSEQINRV